MDKAQSALDSGNCKTAIKLFKKGTDLKNARAEYSIGVMLYKGICLEKNINKAIQWIKLSASRDYPSALFTIAQQYRKGQNGFEKNVEKAIKYYRKAVKLNSPAAQYILGIYYLYGAEVSIKKIQGFLMNG